MEKIYAVLTMILLATTLIFAGALYVTTDELKEAIESLDLTTEKYDNLIAESLRLQEETLTLQEDYVELANKYTELYELVEEIWLTGNIDNTENLIEFQPVTGTISVSLNGKHWYSGKNLITNEGLRYFASRILTNNTNTIQNISIGGNNTAFKADDTTLQGFWASCGLTSEVPDNIYNETQPGNTTFSSCWVATANNCYVNTTGLWNGTTSGVLIAEGWFINAPMQNNDQLCVNYSIGFTNSTS